MQSRRLSSTLNSLRRLLSPRQQRSKKPTGYNRQLGMEKLEDRTVPTVAYAALGTTYTQNFDTLPSATLAGTSLAGGVSNTPYAFDPAPISWNGAGLGTNDWYYSASGTPARGVGTGSSTSGALYSFGSVNNPERSLGSLPTNGTGDQRFGAIFINNTGSVINNITLTYTGEVWRRADTVAGSLLFSYATGAGLTLGSTTTGVSSLNFNSPVASGTSAALDGNFTAANRIVGITANLTGINWQTGENLLIRWDDSNDLGSDSGLAIDDLTLTTNTVGQATVVYVNSSFPNSGAITDLDPIRDGNQPGTIGVDGFQTIADAQTAVAAGGTIIVLPGSYTSVPTLLGGTVQMNIIGAVTFDNLTGVAGSLVNLNSGSTLTIDSATDRTFAGSITGSGNFTKTNTNILTLTGTGKILGTITVNNGVLRAGSASTFPYAFATQGPLVVDTNATFRLNGFNAGFNTISGAGTIENASSTSVTLTIDGVLSSTFSGSLRNGTGAGTLGLTKVGSGTVLGLSGTNTYTGITYARAGMIKLLSQFAVPGGIGATGGTSSVQIGINALPGYIGLAHDDFLRPIGTGPSQFTYANGTSSSGGFAAYGADRIVNFGGLVTPSTVTWATTLSQFMAFGFADATNAIDFKNPINMGTTARSISTTAPTATTAVVKFSGVISGNASLTFNGSGVRIFTADNSYTGDTGIGFGSLQLGDGGLTGSVISPNINHSNSTGFLIFNRSDDPTYNGVINGTANGWGQVTQAGPGTVTLTGLNTFSYGLNLINGFVAVSNRLSLGQSSAVNGGHNIRFNGGGLKLLGSISFANTENPWVFSGVGGTIDTNGNTLTRNMSTTGVLSGVGTLKKIGAGEFVIIGTGAAPFTGTYETSGGSIRASLVNMFSNSTGMTVNANGTLDIRPATGSSGSFALSGVNPVTLAGGTFTLSPAVAYALSSSTPIIATALSTISIFNNAVGASSIALSGLISGAGGLIFDRNDPLSTGPIAFTTSNANTYTGITRVNAGTLTISNLNGIQNSVLDLSAGKIIPTWTPSGTRAIGGLSGTQDLDLTTNAAALGGIAATATYSGVLTAASLTKVGTGTQAFTGVTGNSLTTSGATVTGGLLSITQDNHLGTAPVSPSATNITLNGGGLQAGASFTLDSNRGITLGASNGTLDVTPLASTLSYGGIIAGTALIKSGSGTLSLSGVNTYTGGTTVSGGTLLAAVAGAINNGALAVANTATLDVGSATTTPGTLNTGNLALAAGSTYLVDVTGTTAGTQYDQLNVTGTVNVTGATLTVTGAYLATATVGDVFTLIINDDVDPVVGTFAGYPQWAAFTLGGVAYTISYTGGTGNDVVLIRGLPTVVTSVAPTAGPELGGTPVAVTGTGFTGTSSVKLGITSYSYSVDSDTQITVTTLAGTGTVDVSVTTAGGTVTLASAYTFVAAPTVTGLSPTSGPAAGSTPVTITGTNFTASSTVSFGSNPATSVTFVNSTTLDVVSPAGSGTVNVIVTTVGGASSNTLADDFTYSGGVKPTAPSVTVNVGNSIIDIGQPSGFATFSRILTLELTFNTNISSVDPGAFSLFNGTDTVTNDGDVSVAGVGTSVLTLTFTGTNATAGEEYYSLADGIWSLTTDLTKVQSSGGGGTGSGVTNNIRRLFGDVNGTGTVDGGDFGLFGSTFGLNDQDPSFNAQFDVNADGSINGGDFGPFGSRFGTGL